jgi:hypothetical protein
MSLSRLRIISTGGNVGTGYTNMYFQSITTADLAAVLALLNAFKPYCPALPTYTIPNSGDQVDETTGHLVGGWTAGSPATVTMTGGGFWPAAAGALMLWKSTAVVDGHRPTGRLLMVPASQAFWDTDGTPIAAALSAIQAAGTAFLAASSNFRIWHRPVYDYTTKPATMTRPGSQVSASSALARDIGTVLRSRRY